MKSILNIIGAGALALTITGLHAQENKKPNDHDKTKIIEKEHDRSGDHKQKMEEKIKELNLSEKDKEKYLAIQKDFASKKQALMKEKSGIYEKIKENDKVSDADLKAAYARLNAIDVEMAQLKSTKFNQEVDVIGIRNVVKEKQHMGKGHPQNGNHPGGAKTDSHPQKTKEHSQATQKTKK